MKICIITGPRAISAQDESLVRNVVHEIINRGYKIYVGDADGVDKIATDTVFEARRFEPLQNYRVEPRIFQPRPDLGRTPAGLAERSMRMVKEALRKEVAWQVIRDLQGPPLLCIGFPNKPCPSGITPARSWKSGETEGSGTWSTIALCVGHEIETWIFPLREHKMSRWYIEGWMDNLRWKHFGQEFSAWHFTPAPSLFSNSLANLSHDELTDGYTELARAESADGN